MARAMREMQSHVWHGDESGEETPPQVVSRRFGIYQWFGVVGILAPSVVMLIWFSSSPSNAHVKSKQLDSSVYFEGPWSRSDTKYPVQELYDMAQVTHPTHLRHSAQDLYAHDLDQSHVLASPLDQVTGDRQYHVPPTTTTTTPPHGTPPCGPRPPTPSLPETATSYNGISWPALCYVGYQEEHVFLIGDWGGLEARGGVVTAPNHKGKRGFSAGLDSKAQVMVAHAMKKRAEITKPRYILNAGDNFYWGGLKDRCGKPMAKAVEAFQNPNYAPARQIQTVFENVYSGPLAELPFLSCLGNHDWGGFQFSSAWDQQIAYTWVPYSRWVMPALYFQQTIEYPTKGMSVDVFMIDSNDGDAFHPSQDPVHNICSGRNGRSSCAPFGPKSASDCSTWFRELWRAQIAWMAAEVCKSNADWQIAVTHFPPEHKKNVWKDWKFIGDKCGLDLIVSGHRHAQELHDASDAKVKHLSGVPYVVTGGGGGVTSEHMPGDNSQYGFMDMTVTKDHLFIENFNQFGNKKGHMTVYKKLKEAERDVLNRTLEMDV